MTNSTQDANIKQWAIAITSVVEPDDRFVIDEGFDDIARDWHTASVQPEGRFTGIPDIAPFVGLIVPFLLGFFGDIAKDVVKDQAKKLAGPLLDRFLGKTATGSEAEQLKTQITSAIESSKFSKTQKATLRAGFAKLFKQMKSAA